MKGGEVPSVIHKLLNQTQCVPRTARALVARHVVGLNMGYTCQSST